MSFCFVFLGGCCCAREPDDWKHSGGPSKGRANRLSSLHSPPEKFALEPLSKHTCDNSKTRLHKGVSENPISIVFCYFPKRLLSGAPNKLQNFVLVGFGHVRWIIYEPVRG